MKKSKVIIPALGVLILSTAASVTGTVAWFTANRTATITAGEFAVVKTNDDLKVDLFSGVGTNGAGSIGDSIASTAITVNTGYKLTDSSFDHTSFDGSDTKDNQGTPANAVLPIVIPNTPRDHVLNNVALASVNGSNLLRGTNTYSAFTWKMKFTVSFSESATKNLGLFIDLSDKATYMHEVISYSAEDAATTPNTGLFTDANCENALADAHPTAGTDYYKIAPDHTGKAFRIAFVPTLVETTGTACMGYTKVWADNETNTEGEGKFVDGVSAGSAPANSLNAVSYSTATTSYNGSAYAAASAGAGKVLMYNNDNTAIPADGALSKSSALSGNSNYLGYFTANAGKNVSITYTCVAWYDGTHPEIVGSATDFERIVVSMKFGVTELTD